MKLLLHIGTHKTGTTALQQFLYANRALLAVFGFYYATPPHRLQEVNVIADALNAGNTDVVRTFFAKQLDLAERSGVDTILASAENFYAMSVLDAMKRREICAKAVERDRALIETLHSLLPADIGVCQASVTSAGPTDMRSRSIANTSRKAFFSMVLSTSFCRSSPLRCSTTRTCKRGPTCSVRAAAL